MVISKEDPDNETAHNADQINRFVTDEVNQNLEPEPEAAFTC